MCADVNAWFAVAMHSCGRYPLGKLRGGTLRSTFEASFGSITISDFLN